MPFWKGKSDKTRNKNIAVVMRDWKKSGKIGNITPKSAKHAAAIASAIAYKKQRES